MKPDSNTRTATRTGLTLLEVLISIFIVAVGLLGVFSLLPVARHEVSETYRNDFVAALGRRAWREVKIRGFLNPGIWMRMDNGWTGWDNAAREPFIIDPLYTNRQMELWGNFVSIGQFPALNYSSNSAAPKMWRRTLRGWAGSSEPITAGMADRIFISEDDLSYTVKNDSATGLAQVTTALAEPHKLYLGSQGDYSWFVMLTPQNYQQTQDKEMYQVAVVVFHKRNIDSPREYSVDCALKSSIGYGGGDLVIQAKAGATATEAATQLPARVGDWMMLSAQDGSRKIFRWYQIIAADGGDPVSVSSRFQRRVTVRGPTWNELKATTDGTLVPITPVTAILVEGAVGVFEKTMELE